MEAGERIFDIIQLFMGGNIGIGLEKENYKRKEGKGTGSENSK
jgi:hypothetical protein